MFLVEQLQNTKMNMKLNKVFAKILCAIAAICLCATAHAQGEFDHYALDKTVFFQINSNITVNAGITSNNTYAVDIGGRFIGSGFIDIIVTTNWGTNTVSVTPLTSPDTTNLTALANFAISTNYTLTYTNVTAFPNSTLLATNSDSFPFINTTPTAYTAGFATPYGLPEPFTNTAPVSPLILNGPNGLTNYTRIGIQNMYDLPRYLYLGVRASGTNVIVATINGRRR